MRAPETPRSPRRRRQRLTPLALVVGLLASGISTSGVAVTYSAMTASISGSQNTAGAGTLEMQETDGSGTASTACSSSTAGGGIATCSRFDAYGGGTLQPGQSAAPVTVRIYSTGGLGAGSFTLTPGSCAVQSDPVGGTGSICGSLGISATCTRYSGGVAQAPVALFPSASSLQSISSTSIDLQGKGCLPQQGVVGGSTYTSFAFTVTLSSSAGVEVQGQTALQTLAWRMTAGS